MIMHAMTIAQLFQGRGLPLIILLLLILINWLLPISTIAAAAASNNNNSNGNDNGNIGFIRRSCGETLYPDLCYTSLSGYAYAVQKDPAVLTRIAIGLSLFRARRLLANVSSSSSSSSAPAAGDAAISSALHDCISVLGDAVDQIRGSLKQMRRLTTNTTHDHHRDGTDHQYSALRLGLNDVQTWMSAALTNEDTCTEGLEEEIKNNNYNEYWRRDIEELCYRATKVKHVTSNALALLNAYVAVVVDSSTPPPQPA